MWSSACRRSHLGQWRRESAESELGTETIVGLSQLDKFFGYSEDDRGPSAVHINTDTGRAFIEQRQAEEAGPAVINRSLACLRRMLKIANEDGKLPTIPVIRLLKEPPARKGFVEVGQFEHLVRLLPAHLQPDVTFLYTAADAVVKRN